MPGTLYVVATPIGNLEDVTLRALRVLREVALIAAEDTRRTAKLLSHYSISTPTTSVREHNERRRTPAILGRLAAGQSVALVSDAGTPGVSDPGKHLVRAALEAGHRVVAVPGASAVMAALASSPFGADEFVFAGFPPRKAHARTEWLKRLADESRTVVFFEAPHRIQQTLELLGEILGKRPIMIARELTKLHEQLVITPSDRAVADTEAPLGEYSVVIGPSARGSRHADESPPDAVLAAEFGQLTSTRTLSRRRVISELARRHGLSQRDVYAAIERSRKSVS
jgi:16S rRNA (cytidine1402-2'-O)-methyltransferase